MDVREKLVEIIQNSVGGCARFWAEAIANHLIANGVTVQGLDGCEYCNDYSIICGRDEDVYISGNDLVVDIGRCSYGCASINFCPMCGRSLHLPTPTPQKSNS